MEDKRVCPYNRCIAGYMNNYSMFYIRSAIIFFGGIILLIPANLSFTSLALYVAPNFIDVNVYGKLKEDQLKILWVYNRIYGCINIAVILFCFVGFTGIIIDLNGYYHISDEIVPNIVLFPKIVLLILAFFNNLVNMFVLAMLKSKGSIYDSFVYEIGNEGEEAS